MSSRPARRYYGTARNTPTRPVLDAGLRSRLPRRVAVALLLALSLAWACDRIWLELTTAAAFEVRIVELQGVVHSDPERLHAAAALAGCNLLLLDLDQAREGLLAEPWVEDARLRRRLPDGVVIEIIEKTPVALERRGEGLALLDGSGEELEEQVARARFELPLLEGASAQGARARGASVLTSLRARAPELWEKVERLDVRRSDRLVLHVKGQPPVWLAGPGSVDELLGWVENAAPLQRRLGTPAHVDARWRGRLYLGREHEKGENEQDMSNARAESSKEGDHGA